MAEASISVDPDQFNCLVCLDLLRDPVTISCGHSFCMVCINGCWDQEDQRRVYSCPQCRETFTPRPVLRRNTMLAEVVEKLKKTEPRAAPPAHCYAGPGDVECDFCTGRKLKAIMSCLVCLASYCATHLQPHYQSPAFKKHKLVKASKQLEEKICSQHDKLIEVYCRTDQRCICYLCVMEEHRCHETVSAAAERIHKQDQLKEMQKDFQQRIQQKKKKLHEVELTVEAIRSSAQSAVEDSERIFTEVICSIEKKRSEVTELIRAQEKTELSAAEELQEQLEQEITDLKKRDTELEQLSHTEDHIQFLQSFQSVCVSSACEDSPIITVNQHLSFDRVRKSLSDLKERLEEFCKKEFRQIPPQDSYIPLNNMDFFSTAATVQMQRPSEPRKREDFLLSQMTLPTEPKNREEFLQYFCRLTLDPNTANYCLCLSEDNRTVKFSWRGEKYYDHPERFTYWKQVLSKESMSGRCYWEVEWSDNAHVFVSVSYKDISRKGCSNAPGFGQTCQSWSLQCCLPLCFYHNNSKSEIPAPTSRIGVYVDHSAGTLSFYTVSDTMTLLHTVQTTFTQPLHAGLRVCRGKVRLCDAN